MEESVFGREIHRRDEVGSTNDLAFELAASGRPEGTVVLAGKQTLGRGRQGRKWHSPEGKNLYFSILLRPVRDRREWIDLPWIIAGAVASALRECGLGGTITLKCPNDVLAGGRKIAGVLLENRTGVGMVATVVAGIGLNVNMVETDFPEELRGKATSLCMELGDTFDTTTLLVRICRAMEKLCRLWNLEGREAVRKVIEGSGVAFEGFAPQGGCVGGESGKG